MKAVDVIDNLLVYSGLNPKSLSEKIGLDRPQAIYDIQKGKTKNISPNMADKIASAFPEINRTWLLTGEGEMLKESAGKQPRPLETDYRLVPLINLDAVGGMHAPNDQHDVAQYTLGLVPFPHAEEGDVCMRVTGNSMIPTYPPGSILLLRAVPDWYEYFGYGHTFVIGLKDGRRILKEVTRSEEDPKNQVLCVSHNKDFPAEELPKSMIVSVYKVVMSLTNEGF